MSHHHLLFHRSTGIGGKISIPSLFVITIDRFHLILLCNDLTLQLTVQVIEIQMVKAIALTRQQDMLVGDLDILQHILFDVLLHLILYRQLTDRRYGICHIDTESVLMTVHGEDGYLRRIAGGLDTGDVTIGIEGHINLPYLTRLNIITPYTHLRIRLSRNGIFISISTRIFRKLLALRLQALKQLHRVLLHRTLVVADPDDLTRISRKDHRRVSGELLFIHPVRNTVDDLVAFPIHCHLTLCTVRNQIHQIDIIVSHKRDQITIGRKHRCLLGTAVTQRFKYVVKDIVDIKDCRKRMTIDGLRLCLNQHPTPVGAHDIIIDLFQLGPLRCGDIKQDFNLFPRTERITLHPFAVAANLSISLPIRQGTDCLHHLRAELTTGNRFQTQLITRTHPGNGHHQA